MKQLNALIMLLLICLLGCGHKKVALEQKPSVLDEICQVEVTRHGDVDFHSDFTYFGNESMDLYKAEPGRPEELLDYFINRADLCRGALLQLMVEKHLAFLAEHWQELDLHLQEQDRIGLVRKVLQFKLLELKPMVLHYLKSPDVNLRAMAVSSLAPFNQDELLPELLALMESETSGSVLEALVVMIDVEAYPSTAMVIEGIMKGSFQDARRMVLVTWSTSDLVNKRELIEPYTEDANAEVAITAKGILESLKNKEKLGVMMTDLKVIGAEPEQRAPQEVQDRLMLAIKDNNFTMINQALSAGARFSQEPEDDLSPLEYLLSRGESDTLQHCLSKGLTVSGHLDGWPLLHYVVRQGHRDVEAKIALLVEAGCNVDCTTNDGSTPLIISSFNNRVSAIKVLLDLGADPNKRDNLGRTPLDIARLLDNNALIKLFENIPAK